MSIWSLIHPLVALVAAPLLLGIINRVKAKFAGRVGPPLAQPYYDLAKLFRKGAVYSQTTSWVFRAGPMVGLAAVLLAIFLVPFAGIAAYSSFPGDLLLFAYLLGLARFFTVAAALDTGSAFEGMGASREVLFSALSEPALFLALAAAARATLANTGASSATLSLSAIESSVSVTVWSHSALAMTLVAVTLMIVLLAENSRIPVDDPNTHLELTMIHEVMILDHCGVDLGFIQYAAALRLWLLGSLLVGVVAPRTGYAAVDFATGLAGMALLAAGVGVIESSMARLRMPRVPRLLFGAFALSIMAFLVQ